MSTPSFWQREWGHAHAWAVCSAAMAGAFAAQAWHPHTALDLPHPPWNWIVALAPAAAGLAAGLLRPQARLVRLVGGGPWAIATLVAVAAACWPIAVFPVGAVAPAWLDRIGLGDPLRSLPFAVALLSLLLNLAISLGRRTVRADGHPSIERLRFAVLHAGLLLAVIGATAGHGGLVRARFILALDGTPAAVAEDTDGRRCELPFSLRLERFELDRFAPMLVVADVDGRLHRGERLMGPDAHEDLLGLRVRVERWLPSAAVPGSEPVPFLDPSANPAALVAVDDAGGSRLGGGWLHPPSPLGPALFLSLPDGRSLHLEEPRPKRYLAGVRIFARDATTTAVDITVNGPLRRDGWVIYLLSYDERMGAASRTVVFEAVEDRALPAVYAGLLLLLTGVLWHLWSPRRAGAA